MGLTDPLTPLSKATTANSPMDSEFSNSDKDEVRTGSSHDSQPNNEISKGTPATLSQRVSTERLVSPVPPPLPMKSGMEFSTPNKYLFT
jgi:hypothetical protein